MICNKCNKENTEGSQFCSYCGNSLGQENSQVVSNPAVVATPATPETPAAPITTAVSAAPAIQPVSKKKESTFSNGQKITIIILLLLVVVVLSLLLLFGKKDSKKEKEESRTIMIYMVGSNLEYDAGISTADLEAIDPSKIDLSKNNVLIYTGGTKEWKNNYVSNQENAIFKLTEDGYEKLEKFDKLNMGEASTLSDFINYAYDNYKAGHYNLIIYDHGGAIDGAVYDDFTGDNLSLEDFKTAMADSPFNEENKLDAVLFRTCLNGTLEVASIFKNYAEYIIFSEEVSYGGNSSNVLSFINNVEASEEGNSFGIKFVNQYKIQMETLDFFGTMGVTYSVVDLSKIDKVFDEVSDFFKGIDVKKDYSNISRIRSTMYQYASDQGFYDTVDLYSLVDKLSDYSSVSPDGVKEAIKDAVIYNHTNIDSSNGISIYFPYNGKGKRQVFLKVYEKLSFSDDYRKFINDFYKAQSSASSLSYDFSKNETKSVDGGKEVSIKLTEDQVKNYSYSLYTVFERDKEHPNYYKLLYNSNDAKLDNDGTLTTSIGNNLITAEGDNNVDMYIPVFHRKSDNIDTYYSTGLFYSNKKDLGDKNYSMSANAEFAFNDGKPFISTAKVTYASDERAIGNLLDLKEYSKVIISCSEYKILDKNGKFTSEWEGSPTIVGVGGNIDDFGFKKASLGDGEYYVVFLINDVNNESYYSDLIKVG